MVTQGACNPRGDRNGGSVVRNLIDAAGKACMWKEFDRGVTRAIEIAARHHRVRAGRGSTVATAVAVAGNSSIRARSKHGKLLVPRCGTSVAYVADHQLTKAASHAN